MIYEIINPSDKYTIESDDFMTACVVTVMLGNGMYGLKSIDGEQSMPIMLFDDDLSFFKNTFGKEFEQCFECIPKSKLADCFDSIVVGNRETYNKALSTINEDKAQEFKNVWNEQNTSSLNNIGELSRDYAKATRKMANEQIQSR